MSIRALVRARAPRFSRQASTSSQTLERLEIVPSRSETAVEKIYRETSLETFRKMAPYIAAHRGKTMVIHVPGEVIADENASKDVMRDVLLIKLLGVKPVLVAGCRPQIRSALAASDTHSYFANGNRVCDLETLQVCQSVAGYVRTQIERQLCKGLATGNVHEGFVNVVSGNFVRAIPFGVRQGVDYKHTGAVQKLNNVQRMKDLLNDGDIVLLGHLGHSPSGSVFHCRSEDVAVMAAKELRASKLVFLTSGEFIVDMARATRRSKTTGALMRGTVHNLNLTQCEMLEKRLRFELKETNNRIRHTDSLGDVDNLEWKRTFLDHVQCAIDALKAEVDRVHLVSRLHSGAIITELFTREGHGVLCSKNLYEGVRRAETKDVTAIAELIAPLQKANILVTRPPKKIEVEVDSFVVYERDSQILACCQLVQYEDERRGAGGAVEMACVAVHPSLRGESVGSSLLSYSMRRALKEYDSHHLFVLTTRTQHWFEDRGFVDVPPDALPKEKLAHYSHKRKPKVYMMYLENERSVDEHDLGFI